MTKKVFLIGSPLSNSPRAFVSGVNIDIQNYYNFFRSSTGGAYYDSEIIYLENPTWSQMKQTFAKNPSEHATFVFSGHGFTGTNSNRTFLNINSKEKISITDISNNIYSSKQLIITDSCRTYVNEEEIGWLNFTGPEVPTLDFPSYLDFHKARVIFNNALARTLNGVQIIYSCSAGEESQITSTGSHFSKSLLTSIKAWSLKIEEKSVLLGKGAQYLSNSIIKKYNRKQNPKIYLTQDQANYPFALRLGTELL